MCVCVCVFVSSQNRLLAMYSWRLADLPIYATDGSEVGSLGEVVADSGEEEEWGAFLEGKRF